MFLKFRNLTLIALTIMCPLLSMAQLTVNSNLTPVQLVQNVLLGGGVTAFNITYTGGPSAIGEFNGVNSNIGMNAGIIMTSGDISNAPGPNNSGGAGTSLQLPGDPDLDALGGTTFDACVLEFDFVPTSTSVKFNFAFCSEEYNEFVNSSFNDVFAFFISGPGINGSQNIALIPNTTLPVSINNVNNGTMGLGPCTNCAYFVDNAQGTTVQYDAFTTVLQAQATVIACDTFHIKLAIADVADGILDSGVLLEAGSFTGGIPNITAQFSSSYAANDSSVIEGCTDVTVIFSYPDIVPNDVYINLAYSGTATNSVDFNLLPDSVKIAAGDSSGILSIYPTPDALNEGVETLIITQTNIPPCLVPPAPLEIKIRDKVPFTAMFSNDTTICPGQTVNLFATYTSAQFPITYNWNNGADTDSLFTVNPTTTTSYTVTITDACGTPIKDTITVFVLPNGPNLLLSDTTICPGQSVTLTANVAQGAPPLIYNWNNGAATTSTYTVSPSGTTTYTLTVTDNCNNSTSGTITVNVAAGPPQINIAPGDTALCPGQSITLTTQVNNGAGPFTYNWSTGQQTQIITITPQSTGTYIVSVGDNCNQTVSDTITVAVLASAPIANITPSDTTVCKGTTLNLIGSAVNGYGTLLYSWNFGTSGQQTYTVTVTSTGVYTLEITDQCGNKGDTTITVTAQDPPTGTVTATDTVCNEQPAVLQFSGNTATNATYNWTLSNGGTSTGTQGGTINATWPSAGVQTYTLTVNDGLCPKLELTGEVQVLPCAIVIPNVFSPNGDGLNETFFIQNLEDFPGTTVKIYNRWGRLLFENSNYQNDWKATDIPDGVYYYVVRLQNDEQFNGTVSIIRK